MIQLDKSRETQSVVFWPSEAIPFSGSSQVNFVWNQDYNQQSGSFLGEIVSRKSWIVVSVSGSDVPAPTGLYTVEIRDTDGALEDLIWNLADLDWEDADTDWDVAQTGTGLGTLLTTERAMVSGSNEVSVTTYVSPNENAKYTTYTS